MKSPFFTLKKWMGGRKTPSTKENSFPIPYDLSPSDYEALLRLEGFPEFETFLKALDVAVKFNGEALLASSTDVSVHYYRGVVIGMRKAASLVAEIRINEERFLADKRTREHSAERRSRGRDAAFFGTPAWNPRTRSKAEGVGA